MCSHLDTVIVRAMMLTILCQDQVLAAASRCSAKKVVQTFGAVEPGYQNVIIPLTIGT